MATLTTAAAHNYVAGDRVTVTNLDPALDGTYTITAAPTTTTFTFSKTGTNIPSTADTGTATVPAAGRAVTSFTDTASTTEYNIPGNENYNPAAPSDYIIASTEDPTP